MIWFVAVTERVNHLTVDTHPALVHRISELLLTCLRLTSHRRVFARRQSVYQVRPVDVRFQVDVHCVSVLTVKPPTPETFWKKYGIFITAGCLFALSVLNAVFDL